MKKLKLIFLSSFFVSCYNNQEKLNLKERVENKKKLSQDIQKMIFLKGDINTYHYVSSTDGDSVSNLYTYATIMAYKFGYTHAYHNCYVQLVRLNSPDNYFNPSLVKKMNINEQNLIKFHLTNGSKLNDYGCMTSLYYLYHYKLLKENNPKSKDSLKREIIKLSPDYKVPILIDNINKSR